MELGRKLSKLLRLGLRYKQIILDVLVVLGFIFSLVLTLFSYKFFGEGFKICLCVGVLGWIVRKVAPTMEQFMEQYCFFRDHVLEEERLRFIISRWVIYLSVGCLYIEGCFYLVFNW